MSTAQQLAANPHVPAQATHHVVGTTAGNSRAPAPTEKLSPKTGERTIPSRDNQTDIDSDCIDHVVRFNPHD